jgi:broad specificity phosphatase PhoE
MVRQRRLGVIVMRHGEREDTADSQWVSKADRPWDPLLTARGKEEAARAGQAIIDMCNRYNLEPPSHVFSSPLTRCVQTARHAFSNLPTKIEPALWETLAQVYNECFAVIVNVASAF